MRLMMCCVVGEQWAHSAEGIASACDAAGGKGLCFDWGLAFFDC